MKIEITREVVRNMAKKLKEATFPVMTFGQSLEATSRMFGYSNWDTFSGVLKQDEQETAKKLLVVSESEQRFKALADLVGWREAPPKLEKPFTWLMPAFSTDEFGESPEWAKLEVTQAFVDHIHNLQTTAIRNSVETTVDYYPDEWGFDIRISFSSLIVDKTSFYFRAAVKHSSEYVETRMIEIKDFFQAFENPSDLDSSYRGWADGAFFSHGVSAKQFARELLDTGVIDINEGCIDQMRD
ncbi:hypothetical protein LC612_36215 [Nostoc sp. CHAB 5834]|nr:hypothetical protein [Nostoc sp. CHAB 5834]